MTAKVRITAGPVEFEYEGGTALSVADIKEIFSHIETLFKAPILDEDSEEHSSASSPSMCTKKINPVSVSNGRNLNLHVNSVAQKLRAKSGSEVAVAAAATLQICEGKEVFTRTELLDTMKKATMHYSTSMSSNLSKTLGTLVGSKFNQTGEGKYSLTSEEYQKLEALLA